MRLTLIGLLLSSLLPQTPGSEVSILVHRLEAHHSRVGDMTARFVQTYRSGVLGQEIVETGRLSLKRPGQMRWEYEEPERKTYVSDGKAFYFYVPSERQVVVQEHAGQRGLALTLLSGQANILEQFSASLAGAGRLELTPRDPDPNVSRVWVELDALDRIRRIEYTDIQANFNAFLFEDIHENVGLRDELFEFEIPRDVEVVRG
jgi:outer membrane lipoprotein carrier protein